MLTAQRFGRSPVSLTFGIFLCPSILPDFINVPCSHSRGIGTRESVDASVFSQEPAQRPHGPQAATTPDFPEGIDDFGLQWFEDEAVVAARQPG